MPGLLIERHVLGHAAIARDQQMGRNPQVRDLGKVRVLLRIKLVAEQGIDVTATVLPWRQADVVNHQQTDVPAFRARRTIRRRLLAGEFKAVFRGQEALSAIGAGLFTPWLGCWRRF